MNTTAPSASFFRRLLQGVIEGGLYGALAFGGMWIVLSSLDGRTGGRLMGALVAAGYGAAAGAYVFGIGRGLGHGVSGAMVGMGLAFWLGGFVGFRHGGVLFPEPAAETEKATAGVVLDIAGPTLNGEQLDIKQWRGKVVLVDFWATWCPPCVAEIPNIRKAYERYHADGFEVVGVSLDHQREPLVRFVEKHKLPWPQIYYDPTQDNPLAMRYQIRSIPHLFLLDREGKVVTENARGGELDPAVAALVGREPESPGSHGSTRGLIAGAIGGGAIGTLLGALAQGMFGARRRRPE